MAKLSFWEKRSAKKKKEKLVWEKEKAKSRAKTKRMQKRIWRKLI